jgi:hypothetical protein
LYQNFIILNKYNISKKGDFYYIIIETYCKDLSEFINDKYFFEVVGQKIELKFNIIYLGINLDNKGLCKCKKSKYYILYSDGTNGPLICGDCYKNININKLQRLSVEINCFDIINWKDAYDSMYNFWLSSINDELSNYQINAISSELSKYGLEICNKFNAVNEDYLYFAIKKDVTDDKCPKCTEKLQQIKNNKLFTHTCEKCKLILIE